MSKVKYDSTAVMARRNAPPRSLDDYPTPPWATRALMEYIKPTYLGSEMSKERVWEPACGRGYMVKVLREYYGEVYGSDIKDYGYDYPVRDFLYPSIFPADPEVDWIITNPPFVLASEFIQKALYPKRHKVALLLRLSFLETKGRWLSVFGVDPPNHVFVFSERVAMTKGKVDRNAVGATAYAWFVWSCPNRFDRFKRRPEIDWLRPGTKAQCEKPDDYGEMR